MLAPRIHTLTWMNVLAWMWKIPATGAFVAYFAVMVYAELYAPGRMGITGSFADGGLWVRQVLPNSPASRAGLRPGDRLLDVDQRPLRTWEDWRLFRAARQVGKEYRFHLERSDGEHTLPLVLGRRPGDPLSALERKRYVQGALLALAIVMLILGNRKRAGVLLGAWLLASIGTAPLFPDAEMTAIWRGLPPVLGVLLWGPQLSHLLLLPLFFAFFASIPRPLFRNRWAWGVVWGPALAVAAWAVPRLYSHIYHPRLLEELPPWTRFIAGAGVVAYGGGGLAALLTNYLRLTQPQERDRLRVFVLGAFVGLAPLVPFLAAIFWGTLTQSPFVWFFVLDSYRHSLVGLFLAFPLSLTYAIVRHRLLCDPAEDPKE